MHYIFSAMALLMSGFFVTTFSMGAVASKLEYGVNPGSRVIIRLSEGQVTVVNSSQANRVTVQAQDVGEDIKGSTSGDEVLIEGSGRILKPQAETFHATNPKRTIELMVPNGLTLEVHLLEGQISLQRWSGHAVLHLEKGKVISYETQGALTIHQKKGDTTVTEHKGNLVVDNFNSQLLIKGVDGEVKLSNFSGDTATEKTKGPLKFIQNRGAIRSQTHQGVLSLDLQKATFSGQQISGRIEGQSDEGSVTVQLGSEAEVHLKSQSARLTVVVPPEAPAQINVITQEGDLYLPATLKMNREADGKSFRGRWRGEAVKHFVNLKSQDGALIIK